jgi:hypothetical protein
VEVDEIRDSTSSRYAQGSAVVQHPPGQTAFQEHKTFVVRKVNEEVNVSVQIARVGMDVQVARMGIIGAEQLVTTEGLD